MWLFKKREISNQPWRKAVAVRLESIGGLGAHSAGKILAEAAVIGSNFSGNHFSSFGSEKRGTPVRSFVKYNTERHPVRSASFIRQPTVLGILHENLMHTHPEVFEGADDSTHLIINSSKDPQEIHFPKGMRFASLHLIDATSLANKYKCGVNAVFLGATIDQCWEINPETLETTLKDYFANRGKKNSIHNLDGFKAGREKVRSFSYDFSQSVDLAKKVSLPDLGWENAPMGGVIVNPGNSILKDHSASRRGQAPKFIKENCIQCGYCDMVCPDFCFVWKTESSSSTPQLVGLDYQYCKGCAKCTMVCPVEALIPVSEELITESEKQLKLFPEAIKG